jgi:hypothetical protein
MQLVYTQTDEIWSTINKGYCKWSYIEIIFKKLDFSKLVITCHYLQIGKNADTMRISQYFRWCQML